MLRCHPPPWGEISAACHKEGEYCLYGKSYNCVSSKNVKGENITYTGQRTEECSYKRVELCQQKKERKLRSRTRHQT